MSEDKKGIRTFVKRFVNPVLRNFAKLSFGPFALLRHVGRRSGNTVARSRSWSGRWRADS